MSFKIATSTDVIAAASWQNAEGQFILMEPGDVIINGFTNGQGQIFYNGDDFIAAGAKDGANIFIDGRIGEIDQIFFKNDNGKLINTPGSEICFVQHLYDKVRVSTRFSGGNRCMEILNVDRILWYFESKSGPGMRNGWGPGRMEDFGLVLRDYTRDPGMRMASVDSPDLELAGFVGVGIFDGFSSFRVGRSNNNQFIQSFVMRNCAAVCGFGESYYIAQTNFNINQPKIGYVYIGDFFGAFRGADGGQIMNYGANASGGVIENIAFYCCGMEWLNPFGLNQDQGGQKEPQDGGVKHRNIIVHGYATSGWQTYGEDFSGQGYVVRPDVPAKFEKMVITAGRQIPARINGNMDNSGVSTEWRNCYFGDVDDSIDRIGGVVRDYYFGCASENGGNHHVIGNVYPDRKSGLFDATNGSGGKLNKMYASNNLAVSQVEHPQFENSGFDDVDVRNIVYWNARDLNNNILSYGPGAYVVNAPANGEYKIYKYLPGTPSDPAVETLRPDLDPVMWGEVTWSTVTWLRSDQPGWNAADPQSDYPPFDFRTKEDTLYAREGIGIKSSIFGDKSVTQYLAQWTLDGGAQPSQDDIENIQGLMSDELDFQNLQYLVPGRWVRMGVKLPGQQPVYDDWFQLA